MRGMIAVSRRVTVAHAAGTLKEWIAAGDKAKLTAEVWPQICGYVRRAKPFLDVEVQRKMAQAIMITMTGHFAHSQFSETKSAPLTREVEGKIRQGNIAYAKAQKGAKRAIEAAQEPVETMDDGGPPW